MFCTSCIRRSLVFRDPTLLSSAESRVQRVERASRSTQSRAPGPWWRGVTRLHRLTRHAQRTPHTTPHTQESQDGHGHGPSRVSCASGIEPSAWGLRGGQEQSSLTPGHAWSDPSPARRRRIGRRRASSLPPGWAWRGGRRLPRGRRRCRPCRWSGGSPPAAALRSPRR